MLKFWVRQSECIMPIFLVPGDAYRSSSQATASAHGFRDLTKTVCWDPGIVRRSADTLAFHTNICQTTAVVVGFALTTASLVRSSCFCLLNFFPQMKKSQVTALGAKYSTAEAKPDLHKRQEPHPEANQSRWCFPGVLAMVANCLSRLQGLCPAPQHQPSANCVGSIDHAQPEGLRPLSLAGWREGSYAHSDKVLAVGTLSKPVNILGICLNQVHDLLFIYHCGEKMWPES